MAADTTAASMAESEPIIEACTAAWDLRVKNQLKEKATDGIIPLLAGSILSAEMGQAQPACY